MIRLNVRSGLPAASILVGVLLFCGTGQAGTIALTGTVRDFMASHIDFENYLGSDPGIVLPTLGSDGKPVYAGQAGNPSTHGATAFNQWYRDVPGVNAGRSHTITLDNTITGDPSVYTYSNGAFFPIDGEFFGNYYAGHNYHFTYELHSSFTYMGGELFTFTGDDDLFVFIDDALVIDLGGVHGAQTASVALDSLGLTVGNTYDFDLFFAERHTTASTFRIDTSIVLTPSSAVPLPAAAWLALPLLGVVGLVRRLRRR